METGSFVPPWYHLKSDLAEVLYMRHSKPDSLSNVQQKSVVTKFQEGFWASHRLRRQELDRQGGQTPPDFSRCVYHNA